MRTLTVTIDKPFFAQVQLQVRGYIRGDVELAPGAVDFGEIEQGHPCEKDIMVKHAAGDDWRILAVRSANPHLSATAKEISRGGGSVTYQVTVRLDRQAPLGYYVDQVVLDTNDRQNHQVTVPVAGRVETAVSLSPSSLSIGPVEPGQRVTKQLVAHSRQPFHVTEVKCDNPVFSVADKDDDTDKNIHLILVTYEAGKELNNAQGTVQIITNIGDATPAIVRAIVAHPEAVNSTP